MVRIGVAALLVLAFLVELPGASAQDGACSIARDGLRIASELRGLKPKRRVECRVQSKADVEAYLRSAIDEKFPPTLLENESRVYKHLGIIPRSFDYIDGLLDMYLGELGGYYDAEEEYYAVADWMPEMIQMPIAVHELTHALQDQHFVLDKMVDPGKQSSDRGMAAVALAEGDATAVMLDFSRTPYGLPPIAKEESVAAPMMQIVFGSMFSPGVHHTPQALRTMLMFPYVSGLHFVHHLLRRGGYKEVDKAFRRKPQSSEHILHPEIYRSGEKGFIEVDPPALPSGVKAVRSEAVFRDTMGEFFMATWLGAVLGPERGGRAAAGWGGDSLVLYEIEGSAFGLLVWHTHWDTKSDAEEFNEAVLESLQKRFGPSKSKGSVSEFVEKGVGRIQVELSGSDVLLHMGLP